MDIITKLKAKKQQNEENKTKKLRLEGQLSQQMKQLNDEFNINTIEEANALLQELNKKEEDFHNQLEECEKELDKIVI